MAAKKNTSTQATATTKVAKTLTENVDNLNFEKVINSSLQNVEAAIQKFKELSTNIEAIKETNLYNLKNIEAENADKIAAKQKEVEDRIAELDMQLEQATMMNEAKKKMSQETFDSSLTELKRKHEEMLYNWSVTVRTEKEKFLATEAGKLGFNLITPTAYNSLKDELESLKADQSNAIASAVKTAESTLHAKYNSDIRKNADEHKDAINKVSNELSILKAKYEFLETQNTELKATLVGKDNIIKTMNEQMTRPSTFVSGK